MAPSIIAVDSSVAVVLFMESHEAHAAVLAAVAGRHLALPAHALAETYSVLTRLPGDSRAEPAVAQRALDEQFQRVLLPDPDTALRIHGLCAQAGIAGGAVYDALVALAARDHGLPLLTRDRRAETTYRKLGVTFELVGRLPLQ